jgi:hypothetical protein
MTGELMGGYGAVLLEELERAEAAGRAGHTVVLVEGVSDQRAIEALARRRDFDLGAAGVAVIPTAGATNIGRFLDLLGPKGHDVSLAGLSDEGEEVDFGRAVQAARIGAVTNRADLESLGFYVCEIDLEDELVRALGAETMVELIESQGQIRRFRSFQNQPAQRHKTIEAQIWRWLGNHKIRYAPLMVGALDSDRIPRPLLGVLARLG